jgi:hypothetical protein
MWKRAIAWDLREIGSARGKGVREGPAPQETGLIRSKCSARAGTTWARTRRTKQVRCDEGGLARAEWAVFWTRRNYVIMIAELILILCSSFMKINHMVLKPIALILCLPATSHHAANTTVYCNLKNYHFPSSDQSCAVLIKVLTLSIMIFLSDYRIHVSIGHWLSDWQHGLAKQGFQNSNSWRLSKNYWTRYNNQVSTIRPSKFFICFFLVWQQHLTLQLKSEKHTDPKAEPDPELDL